MPSEEELVEAAKKLRELVKVLERYGKLQEEVESLMTADAELYWPFGFPKGWRVVECDEGVTYDTVMFWGPRRRRAWKGRVTVEADERYLKVRKEGYWGRKYASLASVAALLILHELDEACGVVDELFGDQPDLAEAVRKLGKALKQAEEGS